MWLRIQKWYFGLQPIIKLLVLILINAVFLFAAWAFYSWYFNEPRASIGKQLFRAVLMSLLLTLPFNQQKVKALFKKPDNNG